MLDGLDLDPFAVLGVPADADPEQIREAYRRQSLKYHPDRGGDEWAFRIVVRAYELVGPGRRPAPGPAEAGDIARAQPEPEPVRDWAAEAERVRPGVFDRDVEPARLVLVEVLWVRLEVTDIHALLARQERGQFSGSIHLRWPDPEAAIDRLDPADTAVLLHALEGAFETLRTGPGVQNARCVTERGFFDAWVSYPTGRDAWRAFNAFRPELKARGLGVRQVTRELTIPRDDRAAGG